MMKRILFGHFFRKPTWKTFVFWGLISSFAVGVSFVLALDEDINYPQDVKKAPLEMQEVVSEPIPAEKSTNNLSAEAESASEKEIQNGKEEKKVADAANPAKAKIAQEELGPRKGFLRDAGRFKIELKTKRKGIDVYLVNDKAALPVVESSHVEGQLYLDKKEYDLKFRPDAKGKRFTAIWPEHLKLAMDEEDGEGQPREIAIVLLPVREKIVGAPVLYKLQKMY